MDLHTFLLLCHCPPELGFISWPPLPLHPAQPLHRQPSSFLRTHLIVPLLLRFQQFLITQAKVDSPWFGIRNPNHLTLAYLSRLCLSSSLEFTQAFAWPGMLSCISALLMHCSCFLRRLPHYDLPSDSQTNATVTLSHSPRQTQMPIVLCPSPPPHPPAEL